MRSRAHTSRGAREGQAGRPAYRAGREQPGPALSAGDRQLSRAAQEGLMWKEQPGVVVWEIDVAREGGQTVVKVVCSGFGEGAAWDELYEGMKGGQPGLMKAVKHYLDEHFGERRRVVSVMRETARPAETSRFLTEPFLTRWLAQEAEVGRPGDKARLVLRGGGTWTGIVNTAAEGVLDMSCEEIGGFRFLLCLQARVSA